MEVGKNFLIVAKIILLLLVNVICAPPKTSTPHSGTSPDENLSFDFTTSSPRLSDPNINTPSSILSTLDSEVIANITVKTLEHFSNVPGEVSDLLHIVKKKIEKDTVEEYFELSETDVMDQESVEYYSRIEVPKSETELIENGEDTEDIWINHRENSTDAEPSGSKHQTNDVSLKRKMEEDGSWLQQEVLAVLSALFLLVFVFSCTVTIMLRKYYRKQYGNSQILINEEDMCDPNDMKYFSL